MAATLKKGDPRPYRVVARGNPLVSHAQMTCIECDREEVFPAYDRAFANPQFVIKKFEQHGWEVYRNATARCPECKAKQQRRKAYYARMDEEETEMQSKPQISLVQPPRPDEPAETLPRRQTYLVVIEGGVPTIKSLAGASEMLFGNRTYLVIPLEDAPNED